MLQNQTNSKQKTLSKTDFRRIGILIDLEDTIDGKHKVVFVTPRVFKSADALRNRLVIITLMGLLKNKLNFIKAKVVESIKFFAIPLINFNYVKRSLSENSRTNPFMYHSCRIFSKRN